MTRVDQGFLINKFKYNENSIIADFYTKESGKTISYRKAVQEETNSWIARKLKHLNFKAPVYFHTD